MSRNISKSAVTAAHKSSKRGPARKRGATAAEASATRANRRTAHRAHIAKFTGGPGGSPLALHYEAACAMHAEDLLAERDLAREERAAALVFLFCQGFTSTCLPLLQGRGTTARTYLTRVADALRFYSEGTCRNMHNRFLLLGVPELQCGHCDGSGLHASRSGAPCMSCYGAGVIDRDSLVDCSVPCFGAPGPGDTFTSIARSR